MDIHDHMHTILLAPVCVWAYPAIVAPSGHYSVSRTNAEEYKSFMYVYHVRPIDASII